MPSGVRDRLPAFGLVALLHLAAVVAFLNAVIIEPEPASSGREERETEITLSRTTPAPIPMRRRGAPARGGSAPIVAPYFNPYTYNMPPALQADADGITTALSACDPGRHDMTSVEVRRVCDRIGLALRNDPGHFGIVSDVADPKHWQTELARREAPHLLPCMKAHSQSGPRGGIVIGVDLATLLCVYRILFVGYDPEKHERYSQ